MRTLRLCGLTWAVVAAHVVAWWIAAGHLPHFAPERSGVRWATLVRAPLRVSAAEAPAGPAPPHAAAPRLASAGPRPTPTRPPGTARSPVDPRPAPGVRPVAGERDQAASNTPQDPPWPVYATRAPPSIRLGYVVAQTSVSAASPAIDATGRATLEWTRTPTSFSLRLSTQTPGRAPREWLSEGGFDAAGLAPERAVERESGRDKRTINFDRAGQRVRFSGAARALAIAPGAQDRWSWIAQLAAIAAAASTPGGPPVDAGTRWELQVAGPRGELDRWIFVVLPDVAPPPGLPQGNEVLDRALRAPALLHVRREPERPYDLRIEAWLSPSLHFLPIGLRMSTPPGAWSLAQWLADVDRPANAPQVAALPAPPPVGGP